MPKFRNGFEHWALGILHWAFEDQRFSSACWTRRVEKKVHRGSHVRTTMARLSDLWPSSGRMPSWLTPIECPAGGSAFT